MSRKRWISSAEAWTRVTELDMERLRFADFLAIRVQGKRDEFSRLRYAALRERVHPLDLEDIDAEFDDERERAVCYRWVLRGLSLYKAIRKTKTDLEVTDNAIAALPVAVVRRAL